MKKTINLLLLSVLFIHCDAHATRVSSMIKDEFSTLLNVTKRYFSHSYSKDDKIGIIGAGPSGVSSALFLSDKGYKNIKVFEKERELGGKCLTITKKDSMGITKNYELGAEYIPYHYYTVHDLCKRVNQETMESPRIKVIGQNGNFIEPLSSEKLYKLIPALYRYLKLTNKYIDIINTPHNVGLKNYPELTMSSRDIIEKYNLNPLKDLFLVKQFGYGDLDDFPALSLFRTVHRDVALRIIADKIPLANKFIKRPIASISMDGTQGLYKRIANLIKKSLPEEEVFFLNQNIKKIYKNGDSLNIESIDGDTNLQRTFVFDKLIFAVPPKELIHYKIFENQDEELIREIQYKKYFVGLLEVEKNKLPRSYFQNLMPKKIEPLQFTKRWVDSTVIARGYNFDVFQENDSKKIREDVEKEFSVFMKDRMSIGYNIIGDQNILWSTYYPHVALKAYQEGIFDQLEGLQGKNNMFYTGSFWSFECMEQAINHSKYLISKNF